MKPILFNTEMVRAILEGRKTVTRRIVKPQPDKCYGKNLAEPCGNSTNWESVHTTGTICCVKCGEPYRYSVEGQEVIKMIRPLYRVGDILYVRETWCHLVIDDSYAPPCYQGSFYYYKADGDGVESCGAFEKWRPSIHMPKEAARIFLKVTGIRCERLQDITEDEAIKEGIKNNAGITVIGARWQFKDLWDSTIKKQDLDKCGWAANPWVWVYEFERCEKPEGD